MIEFLLAAVVGASIKALRDNSPEGKEEIIISKFKEGKISKTEAIKSLEKLNNNTPEFRTATPKGIKDILEAGYNEETIKQTEGYKNLSKPQQEILEAKLDFYKDMGTYDFIEAANNRKYGKLVQLQGNTEAIKRILESK